MHPALQIQEILLNIFGHCFPPSGWEATTDLAALARTCHAFKDPALDVLWEELFDLSPLARCLPEACYQESTKCYSLHRKLTQSEWDILQSYTRRIRSIRTLFGIDRQTAQRLWRAPTPSSFFPSLRHLHIEYSRRAVHLLLMPLPSLVSLTVIVHSLRLLEDSLKSLSQTSPSLCKLLLQPHRVNMHHFDPAFMCQWRHLRNVVCSGIFLDVTTLVHLSRMSALTQLEFKLRSTLPDQISPYDSPLVFSHLEIFTLHSEFLGPIVHLLSQTQFLVVEHFRATIECRPSRQDLSSFLASAQTSGLCHTAQQLSLCQEYIPGRTYAHTERPVLGFQYLQPFMAFIDLRGINLDIEWNVNLTESELLTFVSGWPHLQTFYINEEWGWNTIGGITPNGLVQLLQICPLLKTIGLAVDTRGYTTIPPSITLTSPSLELMDVLDSFIEEESVPAITAFFTDIMLPSPSKNFSFWEGRVMRTSQNWEEYWGRWWGVSESV
ncbi:hypothetical protein EV363DRAFT_1349106 [Boletus edulis]|nr:hypothetical protein EV363DRAFT_1349106 [Boletus edulis]